MRLSCWRFPPARSLTCWPRVLRRTAKPLSRYIKPGASGTLLSLILFEQGFCQALLDLGLKDAMAWTRAEIRRFFDLPVSDLPASQASALG